MGRKKQEEVAENIVETIEKGRKTEEAVEFSRKHKEEITDWENTRFILGPFWDLN